MHSTNTDGLSTPYLTLISEQTSSPGSSSLGTAHRKLLSQPRAHRLSVLPSADCCSPGHPPLPPHCRRLSRSSLALSPPPAQDTSGRRSPPIYIPAGCPPRTWRHFLGSGAHSSAGVSDVLLFDSQTHHMNCHQPVRGSATVTGAGTTPARWNRSVQSEKLLSRSAQGSSHSQLNTPLTTPPQRDKFRRTPRDAQPTQRGSARAASAAALGPGCLAQHPAGCRGRWAGAAPRDGIRQSAALELQSDQPPAPPRGLPVAPAWWVPCGGKSTRAREHESTGWGAVYPAQPQTTCHTQGSVGPDHRQRSIRRSRSSEIDITVPREHGTPVGAAEQVAPVEGRREPLCSSARR